MSRFVKLTLRSFTACCGVVYRYVNNGLQNSEYEELIYVNCGKA